MPIQWYQSRTYLIWPDGPFSSFQAIPWKKNKNEDHAVFAVVGIGSNPNPPARTQTERRAYGRYQLLYVCLT